jgi:hypothetical protein
VEDREGEIPKIMKIKGGLLGKYHGKRKAGGKRKNYRRDEYNQSTL